MKILTIHNRYQLRGGEDEVHDAEEQLLRSRGHEVRPVIFDNAGIHGLAALRTGVSGIWSQAAYRRVSREIAAWRPDIVNVHNFFPLASPAVHYAASRAGVPVIQTLHNFRTLCPNGVLFRNGSPCEECLGMTIPWPGIAHACYRDNRAASAAVAAMIGFHNLRKTWQTQVSLFFVLSEFARQKFIRGGFPPQRLMVKPNFVPMDLGPGSGDGDFVFYAGRLSHEKGIPQLLNAWRAGQPRGRLLLAGDGPLSEFVREQSASDPSIEYLGRLALAETYEYMGRARALVFPSLMYEGMPRVIIESFSRGTPVIAHRDGSMMEMIRDRQTGWLVDRDDRAAMTETLAAVFREAPDPARLRTAARAEFTQKYTAERQYDLLMKAYQRAIETESPQVLSARAACLGV